jgi:RNA recognition motif-containing protein
MSGLPVSQKGRNSPNRNGEICSVASELHYRAVRNKRLASRRNEDLRVHKAFGMEVKTGMKQSLTAATRLLFTNVPVDCRDEYLWLWVEARGYRVSKVRLIRDQVSGTSPSFAYVQLMNAAKIEEAVRSLDGQDLNGRRVQVAPVVARTA